jgi:alpha-D-ribose 1-methylphosphonate 5-triphosphate synthase subunit PhnG
MHLYSSALPCSINPGVRCRSIAYSGQQGIRTPWLPCMYQQHTRCLTSVTSKANSNPDVSPLAAQDPGSHQAQARVRSSTATVSAAAVAAQRAVDDLTSSSSNGSNSSSNFAGFDVDAAAAAVAAEAHAEAAEAHADVAQRLSGCLICQSSGRVPCKECDGRGFLKRGGYMKKNPLNMSRITGQSCK